MTSLGPWSALLVLAAGSAYALAATGLPGAWLIGPLVIAIAAALSGLIDLRVHRRYFTAAQATIGCLIAAAFTPPVVADIVRNAPIMLLVIATTVCAAALAGWLLARFGSLTPATAAWGSSPGGAAAMTAMSAEFGADVRLVAFMQYLRVTLVVLSAGVIARMLLPHGVHVTAPGSVTADPVGWLETLAVGAAGVWGAQRLRAPGAALLGPMLLGAALQSFGLVRIAVPAVALDAAYVAIGLTVGLQYTTETVRYALRALPQLLVSMLVLIALCCGSAALLAVVAHVDPLTAYLATTPGGLDSVTAIALGSGANVPLVLALQALRLFVVILTGPPIAKFIARQAPHPAKAQERP